MFTARCLVRSILCMLLLHADIVRSYLCALKFQCLVINYLVPCASGICGSPSGCVQMPIFIAFACVGAVLAGLFTFDVLASHHSGDLDGKRAASSAADSAGPLSRSSVGPAAVDGDAAQEGAPAEAAAASERMPVHHGKQARPCRRMQCPCFLVHIFQESVACLSITWSCHRLPLSRNVRVAC